MAGERRIHVDSRSRSIERQMGAVAEKQHAMIQRLQLMALGLHPSAIDRRVAGGRSVVVADGVGLEEALEGQAVAPLPHRSST